MKGDLVNWESSDWDVVNMNEIMLESSILCKGQELGSVLIPGQFNLREANLFCKVGGGEQTVIKSLEKQLELKQKFLNSSQCSSWCKIRSNINVTVSNHKTLLI